MEKKMSTMREMKMPRQELLEALRDNRESHRETFLQAQKGYREAVISELDKMLCDARKGLGIKRQVTWPEPEDHTDDYDQAIRMLEMCTDEEIWITSDDFDRLVMDNWGWKARWSDVTSNYTQ